MGVELGRIGQIHLRVGEVSAAESYYRDRLGMRFLFRVPGMAFFDCGGVRLMLGEPEGGGEEEEGGDGGGGGGAVDARTILYFDVPDIEAAHRSLEAEGVRFIEPPRKVAEMDGMALWLAFFRDPWSNVLALMSEVPT